MSTPRRQVVKAIVRRTIVGWCAAGWFVAMVPFISAQPQASGRLSQANVGDLMRDTPLLVARQNLLLARSQVLEHRYSEAVPALLTTAEALAFFEQQEIGRYSGDGGYAGDTRQQILNYANDIETDHYDALRNIDAWLNQIRQWDQRRRAGN